MDKGRSKIYLYVPNLIGYARIILAILSFVHITRPFLFLPLYSLSCLLDAVDGHAARLLNQCSKLGAVLDMVTDRSTTAGLTAYLGHIYPDYMAGFLVLIGLDLSSHYMHMYSSLLTGSESHKTIKKEGNYILHLYYTSRLVLFWVCACNEIFYVLLYCRYHKVFAFAHFKIFNFSIDMTEMLLIFSAPIWIFKQFCNVIQMINAANQLIQSESEPESKSQSKSQKKINKH